MRHREPFVAAPRFSASTPMKSCASWVTQQPRSPPSARRARSKLRARSGRGWKTEDRAEPAERRGVLQFQASAVELCDVAHDRQPQSRSGYRLVESFAPFADQG